MPCRRYFCELIVCAFGGSPLLLVQAWENSVCEAAMEQAAKSLHGMQ
jgi:hypothetical protein